MSGDAVDQTGPSSGLVLDGSHSQPVSTTMQEIWIETETSLLPHLHFSLWCSHPHSRRSDIRIKNLLPQPFFQSRGLKLCFRPVTFSWRILNLSSYSTQSVLPKTQLKNPWMTMKETRQQKLGKRGIHTQMENVFECSFCLWIPQDHFGKHKRF